MLRNDCSTPNVKEWLNQWARRSMSVVESGRVGTTCGATAHLWNSYIEIKRAYPRPILILRRQICISPIGAAGYIGKGSPASSANGGVLLSDAQNIRFPGRPPSTLGVV